MKLLIASAIGLAILASSAYAGDNTAVGLSNSGSASSSSVNISGGKSYRQVGAAIAPGLAVGAYSCSGSVSAGVGGSGFGIAFGSTVMDRDCNTRENAKVAQAFGMDVARKVLCNIREIRDAAPQCGVPAGRALTRSPARATRVVASSGGGWGQRSN